MLWKEGEKVHFKRLYNMNFHIYCEMSNFASASAGLFDFWGGGGRVKGGDREGGSIGFRGFKSVKFEKGQLLAMVFTSFVVMFC